MFPHHGSQLLASDAVEVQLRGGVNLLCVVHGLSCLQWCLTSRTTLASRFACCRQAHQRDSVLIRPHDRDARRSIVTGSADGLERDLGWTLRRSGAAILALCFHCRMHLEQDLGCVLAATDGIPQHPENVPHAAFQILTGFLGVVVNRDDVRVGFDCHRHRDSDSGFLTDRLRQFDQNSVFNGLLASVGRDQISIVEQAHGDSLVWSV